MTENMRAGFKTRAGALTDKDVLPRPLTPEQDDVVDADVLMDSGGFVSSVAASPPAAADFERAQTLDRAVRVASERPMPVRGVRGISLLVRQGLRSPERKRLESEVELLRQRLPANSLERREILDLAALAEREADVGDLDSGWKYLHEARRLSVKACPPEALQAMRVALLEEANAKLRDWRKAAVMTLLASSSPADLMEARRLFDEHTDNIYMRNRLLRRQMSIVSLALIVAAGALVFITWRFGGLGPADRSGDVTLQPLAISMTLGAIAACLSALLSFSSASVEQRIPERLANVFITFTRPLIGAASGLVGLLALKSNFVNLPEGAVGWIIPFVFGFSERFVVGALNTPVEPKTDGK